MNKIKAILIDDEADALTVLSAMINELTPQVEIINATQSGLEGIKSIQKWKPDLVFLDIEMAGLNGFEVLDFFENRTFKLIFVTAYDQYAIKAIREKADNYLLKPINPQELEQAVAEIAEELNHDSLQAKQGKIAIPIGSGYRYIDTLDIECIQADNSYSFVHLTSGEKIIVCRNLKSFENALNQENFMRINRSFLINVNQIELASKEDGGYVQMKQGRTIEIPQRKKERIFHQLKERFIVLR
ncbi:response regulator transcription factor [bacterium SCSIO 12741]|nr:response regulator transcription factor [bacterium SCSIO 12741]